MPDGVWVGCLVLLVFLTGVIVGVLFCPQPSVTPTSVLQHRLDAVDARLRALEQRGVAAMSDRAEERPVFRMALQEVLPWWPSWRSGIAPGRAGARTSVPRRLADLVAIRASLQRSVAHLDRLLGEWDQGQGATDAV